MVDLQSLDIPRANETGSHWDEEYNKWNMHDVGWMLNTARPITELPWIELPAGENSFNNKKVRVHLGIPLASKASPQGMNIEAPYYPTVMTLSEITYKDQTHPRGVIRYNETCLFVHGCWDPYKEQWFLGNEQIPAQTYYDSWEEYRKLHPELPRITTILACNTQKIAGSGVTIVDSLIGIFNPKIRQSLADRALRNSIIYPGVTPLIIQSLGGRVNINKANFRAGRSEMEIVPVEGSFVGLPDPD